MQQNYVCLITSKNINDVEKTIKQLGMEVIFKTSNCYIDAGDFNEEERNAWLDGLEERLARNLEVGATFSKSLEDLAQAGRKHVSKIYSLLKQYRENPSKEILYLINMHEDRFIYCSRDIGLTASPTSMLEFIAAPGIYPGTSVNVSCLIARKGENVVRYISIRENNDPLITIIGPHAEIIKVQMEAISKLDDAVCT